MKYYCKECGSQLIIGDMVTPEDTPFESCDVQCPLNFNHGNMERRPDVNETLPSKYKNIVGIFEEIRAERKRQDEKFGEQNHPMLGVYLDMFSDCKRKQFPSTAALKNALERSRKRIKTDMFGWLDILFEEVCEAFLETEPEKQREEMIQVAVVAVEIIEYLDRKIGGAISE
jgi:hypothetical protein